MATATASDSPMALESRGRPWGFLLIQGIALVIIGAIMLWAPAKTRVETYQILIVMLGIYWIVDGVLELVHMFTDHSGWGWKLFMGIIGILAGIYIVSYPVVAGVVLPRVFVLVLGIWGLLQGIMVLILSFRGGGWGLAVLGILGIIFGVILIANYTAPGIGLSLIWAAAFMALVGGIFLIFRAVQQRNVTA
jgi:uncharacterized membrane protein HdeD (DUF308 family)